MLESFKIIGVHPVPASEKQFRNAVVELSGIGLTQSRAEKNVREHFDGLFLIEVEIYPPDVAVKWNLVTQPIKDRSIDLWQVPYDERPLDEFKGRWAFFFHFLDLSLPLGTPIGNVEIPAPEPIPEHLASIDYELP